jgi:hypothetical protein
VLNLRIRCHYAPRRSARAALRPPRRASGSSKASKAGSSWRQVAVKLVKLVVGAAARIRAYLRPHDTHALKEAVGDLEVHSDGAKGLEAQQKPQHIPRCCALSVSVCGLALLGPGGLKLLVYEALRD